MDLRNRVRFRKGNRKYLEKKNSVAVTLGFSWIFFYLEGIFLEEEQFNLFILM